MFFIGVAVWHDVYDMKAPIADAPPIICVMADHGPNLIPNIVHSFFVRRTSQVTRWYIIFISRVRNDAWFLSLCNVALRRKQVYLLKRPIAETGKQMFQTFCSGAETLKQLRLLNCVIAETRKQVFLSFRRVAETQKQVCLLNCIIAETQKQVCLLKRLIAETQKQVFLCFCGGAGIQKQVCLCFCKSAEIQKQVFSTFCSGAQRQSKEAERRCCQRRSPETGVLRMGWTASGAISASGNKTNCRRCMSGCGMVREAVRSVMSS